MRIKYTIAAVSVLTAAIGIISLPRGSTYVDTGQCAIATGDAALKSMDVYSTALDGTRLKELEEYLTGVVAAEMPAAADEEALRAQAVAARTYALRALEADPSLELCEIGQAYISDEEMRKKWGGSSTLYRSKVRNAVESTEGIIMLYEGSPILAAFCACSAGMTEDSALVWGQALPYLTSVDSHWDRSTKDFEQTVTLKKSEVTDRMGGIPEVVARTEAGYVKSVYAGGREFTGSEARQLLGLRSACFTLSVSGENVCITTRGYGHGVGMSQTGAAAMADEGSTYEDILAHYYPGAELGRIEWDTKPKK